MPEGGEAVPEGDDHPFVGPITRTGGVIHLGLRLAYDTGTALPGQPTEPAHWSIPLTSGALPDPITRKPQEDEA